MAASLESQQRPVTPVIFFFRASEKRKYKVKCRNSPTLLSEILLDHLQFPLLLTLSSSLFSHAESETSLGVTGAESAQGAASARRNGMETIPFGSSLSTAFDLPFAELGVRMRACLALLREKQRSGLARWVSERERITPNRTPFVVFAPGACAPRRGAARRGTAPCARTIHGGRDSRSRGSPFVCVGVGAGDNGPSADFPSPRRADPRRHGNRERDGNGRARLSSGAYGNQPARRSSKCHW